MTDQQTATTHPGLDALLGRSVLETIWRRRTHRVSRGSSVTAGSMSYQSSQPRTPLSELEEAVLIAITGCTGLTMPDRPFADPRDGTPIMSKPNLNMAGGRRAAPTTPRGPTSSSSTTAAPTSCASCRRPATAPPRSTRRC